MAPLEFTIGLFALAILVPIAILMVEVLAVAFGKRYQSEPVGMRPRLAVLIPAHDEALGIRDAVQSLIPQLQDGDRLLVVADNCTDDTGLIAASAGAEVIVRSDGSRRGKGYAVDFGVRHLERDPPQVVLIIDADCQAAKSSIDRLARLCLQTHRPVQALYLMRAPPGSGVKVRVAEFAWVLKNHVRALGLRTLGLPCQLMGTGMAFPWSRICEASLATGHIVEDLKLGLELASSGTAPLFCPEAEVSSSFPVSKEGFASQRTRWEHGYLDVLLKDAPGMLLKAFRSGNTPLLAMALDLCVPPIALLALSTAVVWLASAALYVSTHVGFPLLIATAAALLLAISVLISWARYGRHVLALGTLCLAAGYALWKIPLYGRFLMARQLIWVRSKRDAE